MKENFDVVLVGGGLSNCLIALRLAECQPQLTVAIVEKGERIGGNQIWSFFEEDLSPSQRHWTAKLVAYAWDEYSVRFPKFSKVFHSAYRTISSDRLREAVTAVLPHDNLITGTPVVSLSANTVVLADQRVLRASSVIDGRGLRDVYGMELKWQKFLGIEVDLSHEHGLKGPIIMDATVPQTDGYRFVYTLPLASKRLLIEDTYFSDAEDLPIEALRKRVLAYAEVQGWIVDKVVREESGVLPMALGGRISDSWAESAQGVALVGLGAGLFHPATGYSFADAVRTADLISGISPMKPSSIYDVQRRHSIKVWGARGFYRYLNSMLFLGADPHKRYIVIERFYGLRPGLVRRFYAGRSTALDKLRTLVGKPPIPLAAALKVTLTTIMGRV